MRGGGATTRFMTLLTTPITPLRPSLLHLRRRITTTSAALNPITLPLSKPRHHNHHRRTPNILITASFHSQPNNTSNTSYDTTLSSQPRQHPWPEWTQFLNLLATSSDGQGSYASQDQSGTTIPPVDAFVVYEELPDDFVRASAKCLAFARARPELLGFLSRRDIAAVVSNGTPFLFKSAIDSARRMRAFIETDGSNVLETEKSSTVDLMKYILSYASNPHPTVSSERKGLYSREVVDSSVRNLLHELSIISSNAPPTGRMMSTSDNQLSGRYGQTLKPFGPNIEMKRGDWICPKCTFMNFARNTKCLECEEIRPKRQLTGAEWECPQCNFNNNGRNLSCLRCDCKKPGAPLFSTTNSISGSGYNGESRLAEKERWFNNISRLNNASDKVGDAISADQKRIFADSQPPNIISGQKYPSGNVQFPNEVNINNKDSENEAQKSGDWFKKISELHNVKDPSITVSDDGFPEIMRMRKAENSTQRDGPFTSSKFNRQVNTGPANNTNFLPFVPFPPGYFARKETEEPSNSPPLESSSNTSSNKSVAKKETLDNSRNETASPSTAPNNNDKAIGSFNSRFSSNIVADANNTMGVNNQPTSSTSSDNINNNTSARNNTNVQSSWSGPSLEGSAVKEPDPLDMSEEAKAERWFKRVAQIKDISELSQIPDEDFPSIMPMRKGVNRFVVSKRKTPLERRLTSQQYRRNLPIVSNNPLKKDTDDNNSLKD